MNYSKIQIDDIANGEGVRISLFVSGCLFYCNNCFNKEAQSFFYGHLFTQETFQTLISYLKKDYISGLSLLGGDPLWQDENGLIELINLCKETHKLNKNIWIWSGFTWEQIFREENVLRQNLIKSCDIFVDGPYIDEQRDLTLKWCGSKNQRVIDVQASLNNNKIILYK